MLMLKILENDLHRSKNQSALPLIVEVPAIPDFLPALVSNSTGKFLVARRLTGDNRIRVGVFQHDSDKIDQLIGPMVQAALSMSHEEGWPNVFGASEFKKAFDYIKTQSKMPAQPHVCLVPESWPQDKISKLFGTDANIAKYRKYCRVIAAGVPCVVFLSRPDMVGLYTYFCGLNTIALLLHNVKKGMAFCT
jgi:hypothetical protein